ncbi:MAG: TIGR00730 family Rossman fold protein [Rhodothermia bacterium]|nr:TIGR00730 family Rossman fold protein [Rhodothermia bacterium]
MKSIGVFCGSSVGARPNYSKAASRLGAQLVARDLRLVYGGGNVGLMGVIADAVLDAGGHVTGVIPQALAQKELAHPRAQEMHVVGSMHERKAMMADLSDGFIAMPGGLGTLEEFFEVLTWAQLGFHRKPVGLLNSESYFDPLLAFIDAACKESFVRWSHRQIIISSEQPAEILDLFESYRAPTVDKWIDRKSL